MRNVDKEDFTKCPECGTRVKKENLYSHLTKAHPDSEKIEEMEKEREKELEELKELTEAISILSDEKKTAQHFLENIDEVPKGERENPGFWLSKSEAHFITEDYEEAKRAYEKALELDPGNEEAEDELEKLETILELFEYEDWDEEDIPELKERLDEVIGSEFFKLGAHLSEKVLELKPDDTDAKYQQGYSYMNLDKWKKAREALEEVMEENPSFTDALGNLALIYMRQEEFDKAKEAYDRFLEDNPNHAPGWNNLGMLYFREEKYEKALETVEKSLEIDENYAMGWLSKHQILQMMDREREAERCLDKAMELDSQFASQAIFDQIEEGEEKDMMRYKSNWGK